MLEAIEIARDEIAEEIHEIAELVDREEYTFIDSPQSCYCCGGTLIPLGSLGTLNHFRCESCGNIHSEEREELCSIS